MPGPSSPTTSSTPAGHRRHADAHRPAALARAERVDRVLDQVQHHLAEAAGVAVHERGVGEAGLDADTAPRFVAHDRQHRFDDARELHGLGDAVAGAREPEQLVHDGAQARDALLRLEQHLFDLRVGVLLLAQRLEVVEVREHEGDGVVDLVGQARRERAGRGQPLAVRELQLLLAQRLRALLHQPLEQQRARLGLRHRVHEALEQQGGEGQHEAEIAERQQRGQRHEPRAAGDVGQRAAGPQHRRARHAAQPHPRALRVPPVDHEQPRDDPDEDEQHPGSERCGLGVDEHGAEHGAHDRLAGEGETRDERRGAEGQQRPRADGERASQARRPADAR